MLVFLLNSSYYKQFKSCFIKKENKENSQNSCTEWCDVLLSQPKSAEETASQKAWQDAEKVWVVHKAGFSGGRVQRIKATEQEEDETPMCKVKLDHGGEVITIEEESIEKVRLQLYNYNEYH